MTRKLRKRIEKLKSLIPRQRTELEKETARLRWLLTLSVAFYLGDPKPGRSVAEAHARALGYPTSSEYDKALAHQDPDCIERMRLANDKLLAKFGVNWGAEWNALVDAFERVKAGFSEEYKQSWDKVQREDNLSEFA